MNCPGGYSWTLLEGNPFLGFPSNSRFAPCDRPGDTNLFLPLILKEGRGD